jgi:hypothetical protein
VLDLAGGKAGQRGDDESGRSEPGLPRGDEDLEKAGIHIGSLGDAGEMLCELPEELEEGKELGNVELAEQVELEMDALTRVCEVVRAGPLKTFH